MGERLASGERGRLTAAGMVAVACIVALFTGGRHEPPHQLQAVQSLPPDVAAAVTDTWHRFARAFDARLVCMGAVELELVRDLGEGDARYDADLARIVIEIPTSPARFPESLAHELGHHLEATCLGPPLQQAFLTAQGISAAAPWRSTGVWHEMPSEHFAEAVVAIVNGERLLHDDVIELSPDTIALVRSWGSGDF